MAEPGLLDRPTEKLSNSSGLDRDQDRLDDARAPAEVDQLVDDLGRGVDLACQLAFALPAKIFTSVTLPALKSLIFSPTPPSPGREP